MSQQDQPQGGLDRRWRGVAAWAVLIGVVWLALVLLKPHPQLVTTDPLLDRYFAEINKQVISFDSMSYYGDGAQIPVATISRWEADFADDPHYWQLKYYFAQDEYRALGDQQSLDNHPYHILEEAWHRGIADGPTMVFLCRAKRQALRDYLERELPETSDRTLLTDADIGRALEIRDWADAEELLVLNAAVELFPDSAWCWYERAFYWLDRGEIDQGIADLAAGNVAPVNVDPYLYPLSSTLEQLDSGDFAANERLAMDAVTKWICYSMPNFIVLKERAKNLEMYALLSGDLAPLAEWHRFTCRMGLSRESIINDLVAQVMIGMTRKLVFEECTELTTEQQDTLRAVEYAKLQMQNNIRAGTNSRAQGVTGRLTVEQAVDLLTFNFGQRMMMEERSSDIAVHRNDCVPVFNDLLEVDFTTLVLPECMQKYLPQPGMLAPVPGGPGAGGEVVQITPETVDVDAELDMDE